MVTSPRRQTFANFAVVGDIQCVAGAARRCQLRLQSGAKADLVMGPVEDFLELSIGQAQGIEIAHSQA